MSEREKVPGTGASLPLFLENELHFDLTNDIQRDFRVTVEHAGKELRLGTISLAAIFFIAVFSTSDLLLAVKPIYAAAFVLFTGLLAIGGIFFLREKVKKIIADAKAEHGQALSKEGQRHLDVINKL